MLDRVDHLAVAPDQEAEIVALEVGADLVCIFLDVDAGLDAGSAHDPLQQLLYARASVADLSVHDLPPASGALLLLARWRWGRAALAGAAAPRCDGLGLTLGTTADQTGDAAAAITVGLTVRA